MQDYQSRALGEERLDPYNWLITYVLDPYGGGPVMPYNVEPGHVKAHSDLVAKVNTELTQLV